MSTRFLVSDAVSTRHSPSEKMYRILIAEDEPRIAAFMSKGLKRSGFVPEVVDDGNLALDAVLKEEFDLLLLDLGLPGKSGQDVLKELRSNGLTLPVIVVTALSIDPQDGEMTYVFANKVVNKPFLMKDLVQTVRTLIEDTQSR